MLVGVKLKLIKMKKKYVNEDQELIRAILGKDKFLMLNIKMIRHLTPNGACYLTYLLDKAEYLLNSKLIHSLNESFYVFRRDFRRDLSLSDYQQRLIESKLKEMEIINVIEKREAGETWNEYKINIQEVFNLLEQNTTPPLKKLNPLPEETLD